MRVRVVRASDLGPAETDAWARIQEGDPVLASPFFRPEFTAAVAAVRDDVRVGVLEEGGGTVGFLPFQLTRRATRLGDPVGGGRSNAHGVIAAPDAEWSAREVVRGCGLRVWRFHHLVTAQTPFAPFHEQVVDSPFMDLSGGFEAYSAERRAAGSTALVQAARKARKLDREVGPLRFEPVAEIGPLRDLMRWKSEQYRRTGQEDRFARRWNVELLERIHATRGPSFEGMLSALWAGDRLAGVHMGMRSRHVWHYWFPTYNPELRAYSPGLVLLATMAEAAPGLGLRTIDLGPGEAVYKQRFASGVARLAQGAVAPATVRQARRAAHRAEDMVRRSPLMPLARSAARFARTRLRF
jgi:CelD/BcsL family acetyltransferase involved in cellulose biosynthesis